MEEKKLTFYSYLRDITKFTIGDIKRKFGWKK